MRNIVVPALAGLSLALIANTAAAETVSAVVSIDDLDLANPAHITVLDRRIAHAVNQTCGRPSSRDIQAVNDANACRTQERASYARLRTALVRDARQAAANAARIGSAPLATARLEAR